MKIRSKALFAYLIKVGALDGTPEQIALAKADYRKLYKRDFKKRKPAIKEIRFCVSLEQYELIWVQATSENLRPISYSKMVLLSKIGEPSHNNPILLDVLQLLSMAINATQQINPVRSVHSTLLTAEEKLLEYLKM